jgi:hypothetical protein
VRPQYVNVLKDLSDTEMRLDFLMVMLGIYRNTNMVDFGGLSPRCVNRGWTVHSLVDKAPGVVDENLRSHRFWNAMFNIQQSGLIYEAVTLYDVPPESNLKARLKFTIRVNDFHAGATHKDGDPSFLRYVGTDLGYYTPAENERSEPEAMWVILPDKRGALVGILRPRFRASTPDVGAWVDHEKAAIAEALETMIPGGTQAE